jgi:glutamyl-Q tRNA(Asp) synthetase
MWFPGNYRGRFAPSPTGSLHFGSLVAAVGSYLDAKHHGGIWIVRMEDLDTPRCVAGAADDILHTLAAFGLHSDEPVLYQSQRAQTYEEALQQLQTVGVVYPCSCTRKEIADSALHGIDGLIYPGTCRRMPPSVLTPPPREGRTPRFPAWRVRTDYLRRHSRASGDDESRNAVGVISFEDELQGHITQHLETEIGDFVVKRADGLFSYQLAVVVDDAFQGITHIVRGADLLHSTPRQIYLQRLLGLSTPHYMHLPVAVNAQGEKLSKQTLASPVGTTHVVATLVSVLEFLQQQPPAELHEGNVPEVLSWGIAHWRPAPLKNLQQISAR